MSTTPAARKIARKLNAAPGGYILAFDADGDGGADLYTPSAVLAAHYAFGTSDRRVTAADVQAQMDAQDERREMRRSG